MSPSTAVDHNAQNTSIPASTCQETTAVPTVFIVLTAVAVYNTILPMVGPRYVDPSQTSRAYHFFDNLVDDTHCVRDEGGFTVHCLLRFIRLGLGLGYEKFKEYVNHVVEKAVRYPQPNPNPNSGGT